MSKDEITKQQSDFLLYTSKDGQVKVDVFLKDETIWLTQKTMGILFWAITGETAAETIYDAADATKIHMGLTTWQQAPDGKILKSDVTVAKNYLHQKHIQELNRLISAYLDLAENRAERQILMKMTDWVQFLDDFLKLSNYPILVDKGKISRLEAKLKAEQQYASYRKIQDRNFVSDFDQEVKRTSCLLESTKKPSGLLSS